MTIEGDEADVNCCNCLQRSAEEQQDAAGFPREAQDDDGGGVRLLPAARGRPGERQRVGAGEPLRARRVARLRLPAQPHRPGPDGAGRRAAVGRRHAARPRRPQGVRLAALLLHLQRAGRVLADGAPSAPLPATRPLAPPPPPGRTRPHHDERASGGRVRREDGRDCAEDRQQEVARRAPHHVRGGGSDVTGVGDHHPGPAR